MLRFLNFVNFFINFLNYLPNKVKKFGKKLNILTYFEWNSNNQQKFAKKKKEKTQHLIRCFKSKKQFKINFLEFLSIFSPFWTKSGKKCVFYYFLKNCEFWSKFDITNVFLVRFSFWKCILLCNFMNSLRSYVTK